MRPEAGGVGREPKGPRPPAYSPMTYGLYGLWQGRPAGDSTVQVDRCICADISFAELLGLAESEGLPIRELAAKTGCTRGCGLCEPYVRLALATGQAAFPVLHPLTIERLIAEAERV